jgi:hypothetical protein
MMLEMINTFNTLPKTAIVCILNDIDKKAYITRTKDFGVLLTRFKTKYRKLLNGVTKVEIHEVNTKMYVQTLHTLSYVQYYESLGYTIIGRPKVIYYTVRIEIKENTVTVNLINARNERIIVGLFETMLEAFEFRDTYYNTESNPNNYPVYSTNHNTKVHYSCYQREYNTRFEITPKKS